MKTIEQLNQLIIEQAKTAKAAIFKLDKKRALDRLSFLKHVKELLEMKIENNQEESFLSCRKKLTKTIASIQNSAKNNFPDTEEYDGKKDRARYMR